MTRVDELQRKYPSLPREFIVKWDALIGGIKDTEVLDKVSYWTRPQFSYQSYDHDVTLRATAEQRPDSARTGHVKRIRYFWMKNGLGGGVIRHSKGAYEVRETDPGQYALYEGEEKVEDIWFNYPEPRPTDEAVTSKGTPISVLMELRRDCFGIMPVRHCEYFVTNEQCKFCNFNSTQDDVRSIGLNRPLTINVDEAVEAYKIRSSEIRHIEGRFELGGFRNSESEAKIHIDLVEKVAGAASHKPNLTVHTQPMDRRNMQRLKEAGADCLTFQPEVWDPELFPEVCPGKARYIGQERYLEAFQEAVDVFGPGNVGGVLVGGVTMIPDNGFKTWQEARDSHVEGNRWMIQHGILPIFTPLRLPPGSVYGSDENRGKAPPTENYLEVGMADHKDMLEYGLYPDMNKLMICALDCINPLYAGDLGLLELAGNPANWLADVIPDEQNWVARFIASVNSTAVR